jgi:8-oxo-dGTP pyrophosphatase MutT (NUDIX family)
MGKDITSKRPIIKAASACVWRGDDLLLIQRGKALGYGFWSFPGGKIEEGESAQDAAVRELFEETNISANLQHFVGGFEIRVLQAFMSRERLSQSRMQRPWHGSIGSRSGNLRWPQTLRKPQHLHAN